MKRFMLSVVAVSFCIVLGADRSMADELGVGDAAPAFQLNGSDGEAYKLADYADKQAVVIAWFPKTFTGG